MHRTSFTLLILFFSILVSGCGDGKKFADTSQSNPDAAVPSEKRILRFGLYATDSRSVQLEIYTPLLRYIQEQLTRADMNVVVKFQGCSTYEQCIKGISSGRYDFSRTGPASYILAKRRNPNIRLIAMEHVDNKTTFNGMIITRIESPIQTLEDIRGVTFAFGNKKSTIGRYLSQAELVAANIYSKDLKSFDYLERHDLVAKSVIRGQHDAGAIKESTFQRFQKKLRVVHKFTNITKPWIASAELENELFLQLQHILVSLDDASLLKILNKTGFKLSSDKDYNFVRRRMKFSEGFQNTTSKDEDDTRSSL